MNDSSEDDIEENAVHSTQRAISGSFSDSAQASSFESCDLHYNKRSFDSADYSDLQDSASTYSDPFPNEKLDIDVEYIFCYITSTHSKIILIHIKIRLII